MHNSRRDQAVGFSVSILKRESQAEVEMPVILAEHDFARGT
ncbi:MAG: hypothetical protein ABSC06_26190 [Rhodopila sp.]